MLQILGAVIVMALVGTLFIRPAAAVAIVLAVGVVGAAILVSWNDIEQTRQQRAVSGASPRENASAAVTVPVPDHPRAGS